MSISYSNLCHIKHGHLRLHNTNPEKNKTSDIKLVTFKIN